MEGRPEFAAAYARFADHLAANGIDLNKSAAVFGPLFTFDPESERFAGEFRDQGKAMIAPSYRPPFVVPESV